MTATRKRSDDYSDDRQAAQHEAAYDAYYPRADSVQGPSDAGMPEVAWILTLTLALTLPSPKPRPNPNPMLTLTMPQVALTDPVVQMAQALAQNQAQHASQP